MSPKAGVLLAAAIVALPGSATGEERRRARGTPIRDSIDRVVERVVLAKLAPCDLANRNGIPCFPTGVENEGPRFSVAEALRRYRPSGGPAPGVPTVADIQGQMSGAPQSASGSVGTDPVCAVKNLWKKLRGSGSSFYLYRAWDERGERPLLTDHKLDADHYRKNPEFQFELIGQYDGECAAVAAWNKALRDAVHGEDERRPDQP